MLEITVKLSTPEDAKLFSQYCNKYKNYDCDYICGRYYIDACSLMGIMSVGLDRECIVKFHCDDPEICETFLSDIEHWVVHVVHD